MTELPARPTAVVAGAALLFAGALALLLTWAFGVDDVPSNGARVFFVVLWSYLGWSAYAGGGWVRTAILALWAVTVWSCANEPSFAGAVRDTQPGDAIARAAALAALAALWLPGAGRWFAAARKLRS